MIKRTLEPQRDLQTIPAPLEDVSLLFINLFLHPLILVMSLVFPVLEVKGKPASGEKYTNYPSMRGHNNVSTCSENVYHIT